jgi:hypothetical protein
MPILTLPIKIYNNLQSKLVDEFLKSTLKGLNVKTQICRVTSRGFVQIAVSGEDESVAHRYLAEEVGLCPMGLKRVEKFSRIKGYITALSKSKGELYVDIGVFSPSIVDATIPLLHLQAQLFDGRKVALKKFAELFGLCENLPLFIKVFSIDMDKNYIEAKLSEKQLTQYKDWTKSLLDRLIILGASHDEVEHALKMARCNRDVVNVQALGLFEHAVACKLGTDAAGLIPKIGKNLRSATLSIFNPREILGFLGEHFIS